MLRIVRRNKGNEVLNAGKLRLLPVMHDGCLPGSGLSNKTRPPENGMRKIYVLSGIIPRKTGMPEVSAR